METWIPVYVNAVNVENVDFRYLKSENRFKTSDLSNVKQKLVNLAAI